MAAKSCHKLQPLYSTITPDPLNISDDHSASSTHVASVRGVDGATSFLGASTRLMPAWIIILAQDEHGNREVTMSVPP